MAHFEKHPGRAGATWCQGDFARGTPQIGFAFWDFVKSQPTNKGAEPPKEHRETSSPALLGGVRSVFVVGPHQTLMAPSHPLSFLVF